MKKRYIWLAGTGVVLIIIVAGMMYTARFAGAVNQSHTAPGAVTATGTPIRSAQRARLATDLSSSRGSLWYSWDGKPIYRLFLVS